MPNLVSHTVFALDPGDVRDLLHIQQSSHAGQQALSEGRVACNDVSEFALLNVLDEERGIVFGEALLCEQIQLLAKDPSKGIEGGCWGMYLLVCVIIHCQHLLNTLDLSSLGSGGALDTGASNETRY